MTDPYKYSPTEAKIMLLLMDGHPHRPDELKTCLGDGTNPNNLHVTLSNLRKKIRRFGQDISCEIVNRVWFYRLLRLTASHTRYTDLNDPSESVNPS